VTAEVKAGLVVVQVKFIGQLFVPAVILQEEVAGVSVPDIPPAQLDVAAQLRVVEPTQSAPPFAGVGLVQERERVLADCPQTVGQEAFGLQSLQPPSMGTFTQAVPFQEYPD
jgi:hypothetical protein